MFLCVRIRRYANGRKSTFRKSKHGSGPDMESDAMHNNNLGEIDPAFKRQ